MKILLRWFLTGNVSPLEEDDSLLGPQTTIWEVKGLVQGRYTYPAKNLIIIYNRNLLENHETLAGGAGIVNHETALSNVLTIHMLSDEELEGDSIDDDGKDDFSIHEFKHEDFQKVAAMLGRHVPVAPQRMEAAKHDAPRTRPAFLNKPLAPDAPPVPPPTGGAEDDADAGAAAAPPPPPAASAPKTALDIFRTGYHGLRAEGADKAFALSYPGVDDPYTFWDCRPCEVEGRAASPDDIRLDLFFFGDIAKVSSHKFSAMAVEMLRQRGFKVDVSGSIREAGCMYPLIAVPISLPDAEAMQLGHAVFEHFGKPIQPVRAQAAGLPSVATGAGGKPPPGACVIQ